MEKNNKIKPLIINFSSEANDAPKLNWNKNKGYLEWGDGNMYPQFILNLYNSKGASMHKSIINRKVKMIAGNGYTGLDNEQVLNPRTIKKEINKLALDYELINSFAVKVVFSNDGFIADFQHLPINKLRLGYNEEDPNQPLFVWFSHNWNETRKEIYKPIAFELFDGVRRGEKVIIYNEYNPEVEFYSLPSYSTGLNWIDLGGRVSSYHLNQLKNNYNISKIISFNTGIPGEEEQDEFTKAFQKKYKGNENAGKIIITFGEDETQQPTVINLEDGSSDTRFEMLMKQTDLEIVTAHEAPLPLFIQTPGSLLGTQDRMELVEEWQKTYIDQRQEVIEEVIQDIFMDETFRLLKYSESEVDRETEIIEEQTNIEENE